MAKARSKFLGALLIAAAVVPLQVEAQTVIPFGTYTGGSSFSTSMTGGLTYIGGGILQLDIANNGPGVFAAIGLVNVGAGTVKASSAPSGWKWNTTSQLGGAGLPNTTWAWIAPNPKPKNGLQPAGGLLTFKFNIGNIDYTNIGFAVHAISGPNDCSTKLGVWNGGRSTNDVGAGNYDPTCGGTSVPEPESFGLVMTGLASLGFLAVRRRRGLELVDENGREILA